MWRIEAGLVRDAGADGFGHGVVDGEDCVFGEVGAGLGDLAVLVTRSQVFQIISMFLQTGTLDVPVVFRMSPLFSAFRSKNSRRS